MPKKKINKRSPSHQTKTSYSFLDTFFSKSSLKTRLLFGIGFVFIFIPTFFYINEFVQLSFFTPKIPIVIQKNHARPVEIAIPSVDLELPIEETTLSHNVWQIADNGVSHLSVSSRPGENGPIILYGHNTNDRFGPIRWLSVGKQITLTTQDGKIHVYTIIKTLDVHPTQTSIFFSEKGETLFLYTCDGFADLERFVVVAKPASNS